MQNFSAPVAACALLFLMLLIPVPAPGQAPGGRAPGVPVKAAPVRVSALSTDVSAVGTLLANESLMIRPEIAGRVVAIHFDEGQAVPKGARLVTLDQSEYKAILAQSQAGVKKRPIILVGGVEILNQAQ